VTQYWFKPKRYGYGASPANWQGWAATGLFVLLVGGANLLLRTTEKPHWALFGLDAIAVAAFVILTKRKTEGEWRWRWGDR
jgi:hypothetical protein